MCKNSLRFAYFNFSIYYVRTLLFLFWFMGISLVLHVFANAVLIWVLAKYLPYDPTSATGVLASNTWQLYLIGGLVLGLLNGIVKPILKIIAFPITILTLGFFRLAINGIILYLLEMMIKSIGVEGVTFEIHGALYFVLSVAILTIFNIISSMILP